MSEEKFSDLFQEKTVSSDKLQPGDRIDAIVAGISGENIFLDIGGKSEGVLNGSEVKDESGELSVSIGDTLKVFFLTNRAGEMVFTTKIGSGQASLNEIEEAFEAGIPVEGKVTEETKGGFSVTVAGQRGFCPYSQMDIRRVENADEYIDQTFSFKIIEFGNKGRNIILSSRALLEEQRALEREELQQTLEEGMQVSGTVTSIRDFGAFVDIGGVDGLIPISEIAWGQTDRIDDVLSRDQKVEVIIKRLDWDNDRISLSLRETTENPWEKVAEKYPVGSVHLGKVSRLAPFGAFVTLEPGIDGLLHISKLGGGRRLNHPREVVDVNQDLTVKIENIDQQQKRIALVPEDFTAEEQQEKYERPPEDSKTKSMGTLGDLLKAQLKNK